MNLLLFISLYSCISWIGLFGFTLIYVHHFYHRLSAASISSKSWFRYYLCVFQVLEEADNDSQNVQCNQLLLQVCNFWWHLAGLIFVFLKILAAVYS